MIYLNKNFFTFRNQNKISDSYKIDNKIKIIFTFSNNYKHSVNNKYRNT